MPNATVRVRMAQYHALRREFFTQFTGLPETMAKRGQQRIKANLLGQRYGHTPLNPAYRKWKKRHGLDTRILLATHAYVDSITAYQKNKTTWVIAPRPGSVTSEGRAMSTLALWLEYGTKRMPRRPHYAPEAQRLRSDMRNEGVQRVQQIRMRMHRAPSREVRF